MSYSTSRLLTIVKSAFTLLALAASVSVRIGLVLLKVGVKIGAVLAPFVIAAFTEESRRHRAFRWLHLSGNRWYIIIGLAGGTFVVTFTLGLAGIIGVRESGFVTTMFSTILAGLFSFVPIVIAVNSLIITRLFGSPESLRERINEVEEFRSDIEELAGVDVSPTDPAGFLTVTMNALQDRSEALANAVSGTDPALQSEVDEFVADVQADATAVESVLTQRNPDLFAVLLPMVNDEYSLHQNETRRLRVHHDLPPGASAALDDVQELLVAVDVVRQYFKVLYLQEALSSLSRYLAYAGIGAFLSSMLVVMLYASGYPPIVHATPLLFLVSLALAVSFLPFSILFSYTLRVSTVIKRTSAPGSFTPQSERPPQQRG